jgi:hypothetical protein
MQLARIGKKTLLSGNFFCPKTSHFVQNEYGHPSLRMAILLTKYINL